MSAEQSGGPVKVPRRGMLQAMGAVVALVPGAAIVPHSALSVRGFTANSTQAQPQFADVYSLICGTDQEKWPTLSCTATDQTVQLSTSLGAVSILTGATPTERLHITADGNVGIGTSEPTHSLEVNGQSVYFAGHLFVYQSTATDTLELHGGGKVSGSNGMTFSTQNTARLVVTNSGNVGIGTILPRQKLHVVGDVQIEGTLRATSTEISPPSWQPPKLEDSWEDYGGSYSRVGYLKDGHGVVHLRGLVRRGKTGREAKVFVLPEGYRPAYREVHAIAIYGNRDTHERVGRLDILTDGTIVPVAADNGWISLDGITFIAAQ